MHGFVGNDHTKFDNLDEELSNPTDLRIFAIAVTAVVGIPMGQTTMANSVSIADM